MGTRSGVILYCACISGLKLWVWSDVEFFRCKCLVWLVNSWLRPRDAGQAYDLQCLLRVVRCMTSVASKARGLSCSRTSGFKTSVFNNQRLVIVSIEYPIGEYTGVEERSTSRSLLKNPFTLFVLLT